MLSRKLMEVIFKRDNFIKIFIIANLFALLESIIYTFLFNDSSYFTISQQNADPGGDFYLSLFFSRNLNPYQYNIFPYPPLSVLFCYLLNFVCHSDLSQMIDGLIYSDALNVYSNIFAFKNTNFILAIITILILAFILSNYIFSKKQISYSLSNAFSLVLIANSGLLAALVRGNLLIGALLFTTIFVFYNDNENKVIREFCYFSLAIAFNIKPYVAIFGFILLAEKRYKDVIKTSIYALILFFVPFIFLQGSFIDNINIFFNTLLNFGGKKVYYMIGLKSLINLTFLIYSKIMNCEISTNLIGFYGSMLFSFALLIFTFNNIKKWQRVMLLTLIMMMASTNFGYILAFFLIPGTMFLLEEKEINFYNIVYLISFIFLLIPMRYGTEKIIYFYSFYNFLIFCLSFVLIYQIYFSKKKFLIGKKYAKN